jgi:hypothetical protein
MRSYPRLRSLRNVDAFEHVEANQGRAAGRATGREPQPVHAAAGLILLAAVDEHPLAEELLEAGPADALQLIVVNVCWSSPAASSIARSCARASARTTPTGFALALARNGRSWASLRSCWRTVVPSSALHV